MAAPMVSDTSVALSRPAHTKRAKDQASRFAVACRVLTGAPAIRV